MHTPLIPPARRLNSATNRALHTTAFRDDRDGANIMLAATCPHCHHAIFADDGTALETLNCPACQQVIGALLPDVDHDSAYLSGATGEPITELPVIDAGEPEEPPEPIDQRQVGAASLVASDNPYAAPQPVGGADYPPDAPVMRRELADLYERFVGALIDGGLYLIAACLGILVAFAIAEMQQVRIDELEGLLLPIAIMTPIIPLLIVQWVLISTTAQSFGKRAMNMRIVRHSDGAPVGFVRGVLLRSIVSRVLMRLMCRLGSLIDVLVIFTSDRRCLHDYIAGTVVVRVRESNGE